MAWVETRITRTSQPQDACGLNTSHPLFSKINLAWTPKSQIFVAGQSGKSVQSSAASPVVSAGTRGVFENQGQNGIEIPVSRVQANNGFSVLYIGGHSSPDWSVCLETSSGAFRRWAGLYTLMTPSGRRTVSSSSIPAGAVVVAGMLNIDTYRMVVNGASVVNRDLSGGDSIGPNRPAQVFQSTAGDRSSATYWNSPSALLVGFDTYLSEADVKSLSDNPWQIFEPEIARIWVDDYVSAGGGATYTLTAAAASLTLTGHVASLSASRVLTASATSFSLTGQDADLLARRALQAEPAAFALTGQSADLLTTRVLSASPAAIAFAGQSAGLYARRTLQADPATITLTGQAADLAYSAAPGATYTLTVTAASLAFTGQSADLLTTRRLTAEPAAFAVDGQAASLSRAYSLSAQGASFAVTGQDVALRAARVLSASGTALAFTGQAVVLSYSGYVEPTLAPSIHNAYVPLPRNQAYAPLAANQAYVPTLPIRRICRN